MSVVIAGARIDLLRALDHMERRRQEEESAAAAGAIAIHTKRVPTAGAYPTHFPLWLGDWRHPYEDMLLAARECAKLGEVDMGHWGPNGPMMRITEKGSAVAARFKDDPLDDRHGPRSPAPSMEQEP